MTQKFYWNQCIRGRLQLCFQGGNFEILLILFRLLTMKHAMQMDVHKTLYYLISLTCLCWLNPSSQSFVWNLFCTSAIRNAFSFHKLPNIHFFKHFLQISHDFIIINDQNNTNGEKKQESKTLRLKTNWANELGKFATEKIALRFCMIFHWKHFFLNGVLFDLRESVDIFFVNTYVNGRFVQWRWSECLWQIRLLCSVTVAERSFSAIQLSVWTN